MTKVNYYKVEGFELQKGFKGRKGIIYGRSKKDVLEVGRKHGFKKHSDINKVRELSLKKEVLGTMKLSEVDLLKIRIADKKEWAITEKKNN